MLRELREERHLNFLVLFIFVHKDFRDSGASLDLSPRVANYFFFS